MSPCKPSVGAASAANPKRTVSQLVGAASAANPPPGRSRVGCDPDDSRSAGRPWSSAHIDIERADAGDHPVQVIIARYRTDAGRGAGEDQIPGGEGEQP